MVLILNFSNLFMNVMRADAKILFEFLHFSRAYSTKVKTEMSKAEREDELFIRGQNTMLKLTNIWKIKINIDNRHLFRLCWPTYK